MKLLTHIPEFYRTDRDRKKPKSVVTGLLMGDPPVDLAERRREAEERKPEPLRFQPFHNALRAERRG